MADLKKINAEYIKHLEEEKVKLNEDVYNDLKNGIGTDLHEENLSLFINQIKYTFKFIENEYILWVYNILKDENFSDEKITKIIQEIQNKNNQNKVLLDRHLTRLDDLIKLLQSRIAVSHRFKMHSQGKNKKPKANKIFVLDFASKIWETDPNIPREEIVNRLEKSHILTAAKKTILENWLPEIDPYKKRDERRKRQSKKVKN